MKGPHVAGPPLACLAGVAPALATVMVHGVGVVPATLVLTIKLAAPVISSALSAFGPVNTSFSYTITATNSPASFNATGLPAGLSINTGTGLKYLDVIEQTKSPAARHIGGIIGPY